MGTIVNSLIWMIIGIIVDRMVDYMMIPRFNKWKKLRVKKQSKQLYLGKKTVDYVRQYYSDHLYNCKIKNGSVQIPYLVNDSWSKWNFDVLKNPDLLQIVNTNKCDYPINLKCIEKRKKEGKHLVDNPSLFLHSVQEKNGMISIEAGVYSYFQRISFVYDFERETYRRVYGKFLKKEQIRRKYLPENIPSSFSSQNTVPLGADVAVIIKKNGQYLVCTHKRSEECANYQGITMVVPSFGFGNASKSSNPLLYSILSEFSEELFDRKEMEEPDNYLNPEWFYQQYEEIVDILKLQNTGEVSIRVIGGGFDVIGGFFNINMMLVVENETISDKLFNRIHGNWETSFGTIKFIPINSDEMENLLLNNRLSPSSAFAISRAMSLL